MADEGKQRAPKKKCSTALKRMKQDEQRNLRNRSFKSSVRTAVRSFEAAFSAKDKDKMETAINRVYSLMDRGVKHGIYKKNKAARTKQRISKLQKTA